VNGRGIVAPPDIKRRSIMLENIFNLGLLIVGIVALLIIFKGIEELAKRLVVRGWWS